MRRFAVQRAAPLAALPAVLLLAACASIQDFDSGSQMASAPTEGEARLWHMSQRVDEAIERSGQAHRDPAAEAWIGAMMLRLFPEFEGRLRVRLLKAPLLNALALPNGSIYVNLGMLDTLESEAQLATVLAHEGIHVLNRHSAEQRENVQAGMGFIVAVNLLGVPLLSELLMASTLSGHSRAKETEADELGYRRLQAAGYDAAQTPVPFERLLAEVKATDEDQPFFFASHPRLEERIANYKRLSANAPAGGRDGAGEYLRVMADAREAGLRGKLEAGRYDSIIAALKDDAGASTYGGRAHYYLGEAYRRRGKDGDAAAALTNLERAVAQAPEFAPSWRALGALLMARPDQHARAHALLRHYLELAPQAADRLWVEGYLRELEAKHPELQAPAPAAPAGTPAPAA